MLYDQDSERISVYSALRLFAILNLDFYLIVTVESYMSWYDLPSSDDSPNPGSDKSFVSLGIFTNILTGRSFPANVFAENRRKTKENINNFF